MSVVGPGQIPIEVIGGLVTNFPPSDLPPGVSPDCPDCAFEPGIPGEVHTRPATSILYQFTGGSVVQFNYLKTFVDSQGNTRNLYLDNTNALWQEYPQGTYTKVNQAPNSTFVSSTMQGKSDTAFGREFMAYSDGKYGLNIPRQWDGTNWDRVSSDGPGSLAHITSADAPAVMDVSVALTALSRTGGIISGTTAAPHGLALGDLVNIAGVRGDPTFNGQWPVASVPSPTTFTAWGQPGSYVISSMIRVANVVTAVLSSVPFANVGDTIVVANAEDPTFDGQFVIVTIEGATVTWDQVAADDNTVGGTLYTISVTVPLLSILAASTDNYNATIQLQAGQSNPFLPGTIFTIAGNNAPAFNMAWTVSGVGYTSTDTSHLQPVLFTTDPSGSIGAGGYGGTATLSVPDSNPVPVTGVAGPAGNITAGLHQVAVSFIMRSGYITKPSPITGWVAAGGFAASVPNIPIGPSNIVVGRLLMFTAANLSDFYYAEQNGDQITAMLIDDNVTTGPISVDFSDTALIGSTSADSLFDLIVLPEVAGFIQFANRILAWGGRNQLPNWQNLSFDGGFDITNTIPLGWTLVLAGGSRGQNSPIWGDYYTITGITGHHVSGQITQNAAVDTVGVARIATNTGYSVRVMLRINPNLTAPAVGQAVIVLTSASLGTSTGLVVDISQLTTTFQEFIGVLTAPLTPVPNDLLLNIYTTNLTNGAGIDFENVEIFPTEQPYSDSVLYGSNVDDPESFQGTTGFVTVNDGDGRRLVTCYIIRERLYMLKNIGGLYELTADPSSDFSEWNVDLISERTGCESINGTGSNVESTGEDWVYILDKKGLYIHWSAEPVKVSQEIQPTWENTINWPFITTAWVVTDVKRRRVLIGVPTGMSQVPNQVFQMDYVLAGASAQEIVDSPPVSPTFTGQLKAHMRSRKWSIWNITSPGASFISRADGTEQLIMSNGNASGQLWELSETPLSDVTGPINAYYVTSTYPSDEQKQQLLQSKGNRILLRYLTLLIAGQGNLQVTIYGPNNVNSQVLPNVVQGTPQVALSLTPSQDVELYARFRAERMSLKIQALADGELDPWFSFQNAQLYMQQDPVAPIRGFN